jgi:phage terminase, large subunit, PBSX family
MDIQATHIFQKNYEAIAGDRRFIINEGGSRSSKTYSLCQLMIIYCLQNSGKVVSVIRKTFPALRATVLRDFIEILKTLGIYSQEAHNKSEHIYTFGNGSMVEFFSVDDEQKIRGRKRDIAWCNEANELYFDDFTQLNMRTEHKLIFDYNPSESASWLYELPADESIKIKSTYRDNPFLPESIKAQIEDLARTDEALYQIYALGEKAISKSNIYSNWSFIEHRPAKFVKYVYGLDFGYNHPTALMRVYYCDNDIYVEPIIYESYLTTTMLIDKLQELGVEKHVSILADYSRPEIIAEMNTAGYDVLNANKVVKKGIDNLKTFGVVCQDHKALRREYENYKWKKIGDQITDEPVKLFDDAMDAIRYATTHIRQEYYTDDSYYAF